MLSLRRAGDLTLPTGHIRQWGQSRRNTPKKIPRANPEVGTGILPPGHTPFFPVEIYYSLFMPRAYL